MNSSRIHDAVMFIFKDWFGKVKETDTIYSLGGDSLDAVEIIMHIEEELDVEDFDDEFLEAMEELTVKQLIEKLQVRFNHS